MGDKDRTAMIWDGWIKVEDGGVYMRFVVLFS